jgi:hypothetical protein
MARRAKRVPGGGSAEPFHGPEVEYRLSWQCRRPALLGFVATALLTVVCIVAPVTLPDQAAAGFSALAVYCGVSYVWRRRFRTRVTSRGIEVAATSITS